jgi:hypothetical protein
MNTTKAKVRDFEIRRKLENEKSLDLDIRTTINDGGTKKEEKEPTGWKVSATASNRC